MASNRSVILWQKKRPSWRLKKLEKHLWRFFWSAICIFSSNKFHCLMSRPQKQSLKGMTAISFAFKREAIREQHLLTKFKILLHNGIYFWLHGTFVKIKSWRKYFLEHYSEPTALFQHIWLWIRTYEFSLWFEGDVSLKRRSKAKGRIE